LRRPIGLVKNKISNKNKSAAQKSKENLPIKVL
jgi:hypothetical protein